MWNDENVRRQRLNISDPLLSEINLSRNIESLEDYKMGKIDNLQIDLKYQK